MPPFYLLEGEGVRKGTREKVNKQTKQNKTKQNKTKQKTFFVQKLVEIKFLLHMVGPISDRFNLFSIEEKGEKINEKKKKRKKKRKEKKRKEKKRKEKKRKEKKRKE